MARFSILEDLAKLGIGPGSPPLTDLATAEQRASILQGQFLSQALLIGGVLVLVFLLVTFFQKRK